METVTKSLDELCVNTLRTLSIDAVQQANSGHPGLPMGAAPMAYVLWQRHLRHDPSDGRDRMRLPTQSARRARAEQIHERAPRGPGGRTLRPFRSRRRWLRCRARAARR